MSYRQDWDTSESPEMIEAYRIIREADRLADLADTFKQHFYKYLKKKVFGGYENPDLKELVLKKLDLKNLDLKELGLKNTDEPRYLEDFRQYLFKNYKKCPIPVV